jgi:hypothetical protein
MSFAVSASYFYLCLQAFQLKQMYIWYALDRVYTEMITTHVMPFMCMNAQSHAIPIL